MPTHMGLFLWSRRNVGQAPHRTGMLATRRRLWLPCLSLMKCMWVVGRWHSATANLNENVVHDLPLLELMGPSACVPVWLWRGMGHWPGQLRAWVAMRRAYGTCSGMHKSGQTAHLPPPRGTEGRPGADGCPLWPSGRSLPGA